MDGREVKSTKYLYQKHDDALLVSYADKKNLEKKHCCPFNNAFKCSCYERWVKETSCSYVLWSQKKGSWCGWPFIFPSILTLQISPMAGECPSIFAWQHSNKFRSSTRQIFKTWCYVNIWIHFSSRKAACSSSHTVSFENSNGIQSFVMQKIERVLCIQNIHHPFGNVDESVCRCVSVLAKLSVLVTTRRNVEISTTK